MAHNEDTPLSCCQDPLHPGDVPGTASMTVQNSPSSHSILISAVFLLSLSSISFEILLARVFSISQWNHLSFMVISLALFGFAASGIVLNILEARNRPLFERLAGHDFLGGMLILYVLTGISVFLFVNHIPLDYFRLPLEPVQAVYLVAAYLSLALPFFFTGVVVSLAYIILPGKTGYVYFSTMGGSACGVVIPVLLIPVMGEGKAIILSALVPGILLCFLFRITPFPSKTTHRNPVKQAIPILAVIGLLTVGWAAMTSRESRLLEIHASPYKTLSQLQLFPDSPTQNTYHSIRGRVDHVESPYLRFAPGLSLRFAGTLPRQWAAFIDGDRQTTFYDGPFPDRTAFSTYTLPYVGYALCRNPQRVLVIQNGGGSGIMCAMASGASDITIVEQHPVIAHMIRNHYPVTVVNDHPRAFLSDTDRAFHVIQIENWGTSIPGSSALSQDYTFTAEAFREYLKHLKDDGKLIFSRKLLLPPADSIRFFATAYDALKAIGIHRPEDHLAMLRNWDTYTLIVSADKLDTSRIRQLSQNLNFDIVFLHDVEKSEVNQFHVFDAPFHFTQISRLLSAYRSENPTAFFRDYLLDTAPQRDDRPYPDRFMKWKNLKTIHTVTGSRLYSLLMSGEIVVAVVFAEAVLISLVLLVLPTAFTLRRQHRPRASQTLFFLSVGAGFMFAELYFIKAYTLLFGDAVISMTVVLSGILVFSGIGGIWSQRLKRTGMMSSLIAIMMLLVTAALGANTLLRDILQFSTPVRYLLAYLILLPPGILLGLPFPLAMRRLLYSPAERSYAWASNGCASVLAAILSAQIATSMGIGMIAVFGALAYFIAFIHRDCSALQSG